MKRSALRNPAALPPPPTSLVPFRRLILRVVWGAVAWVASAQVAETYTITDITGWTSNQLATLPWFAHWIPLVPAGTPARFDPAARNGSGALVGVVPGTYPVPERGALVQEGTITHIPAWGGHNWSYWSCDAEDCHFFWGRVEHSPAFDVNALGQVVGHATVETPASSSPLDAVEHAYLFDPATGQKTDLTPEGASYARAMRLNDLGVVIGNFSTPSNSLAYRREPDGTRRFFTHPPATVQPMVLNNAGLVAGTHTTYTVSNRLVVPWIAHNTTNLTPLPLPPQGDPDTCTFTDLNHHGLLVGWANRLATPWETTAVRWWANADGSWVAEDLNEIVDAGDYILDRVLAANDAGHLIVAAHLDTESQPPRTLLLTPDVLPSPTALTLPPADLTPTSAVLRATVNACDGATTVRFDWGTGSFSTTQPATPDIITGTAPVLLTCSLTGLQPHTRYLARVRATNSRGQTLGQDLTFTTPYDYLTWATEHFGAAMTNQTWAGPAADPDGDGWSNASEFVFGLAPRVPDSAVRDVSEASGRLTLTYARPRDRAGFTLLVEAATDLSGPWRSGPGAAVVTQITPEGPVEVLTVRTDFPEPSPRQFLRLRVQAATF